MNPSSITNAQLHFSKQLLTKFQHKSLDFDEMYVKQMLYAQFRQVLSDIYKISSLQGDYSIAQGIDHLLDQLPGMAESNIIKNLVNSNDTNFINKILDFKMDKDIQEDSNSIFKTVNSENEIYQELKNLIQSIREMSVQQ